jgi:hypothetical protein
MRQSLEGGASREPSARACGVGPTVSGGDQTMSGDGEVGSLQAQCARCPYNGLQPSVLVQPLRRLWPCKSTPVNLWLFHRY